MAKKETYDAGSISVLEGLEAVRKRPSQILAKGIRNRDLPERNIFVRDRHIILSKAYIYNLLARAAVKAVKVITAERTGDLSCAIRTEIEEDNRISILNGCGRLAILHNNGRKHKLIRHAVRIRICDCLYAG